MYNRNSEIDMDSVAAFLKDAVDRVKTQENPDLLTDLKKVFKKNVPLSLRNYVAAFLVKETVKHFRGGYRPRRDFHDNKKNFRERTPRENKSENYAATQEERTPRPRVQIDPSVAATIFISIGRNRRVFPRDLVGLLVGAAGLERDRIGDIRVLANYSFVQLFSEDAEKAIASLNGYDYRGRRLVVSFSKQREDGTFTADEAYDSQSAEDAAAYAAATKAAVNNEPFASPHYTSPEDNANEEPLV